MSLETILESVSTMAGKAAPLGSTLKFDFGDDQQIFLDGKGDANTVTAENKEAECTVNVTMDDFKSLVSGDLNPMSAFMTGKIKVSGDMGVAMKLQNLFS